jgi:adenine-specific DNA-methyltransferase
MKFNDGIDSELALLSYYNSISFAFAEICGRSYGGGVLEILPGEMGNIMLPRIDALDAKKKTELINQVDKVVRDNSNIEYALDLVDKEILVGLLGMDESTCRRFRNIWKKLQQRRLGRN